MIAGKSSGSLRASAVVLFISLIAGRFDLGSVSPLLAGVDIRLVFLALVLLLLIPHLPHPPQATGHTAGPVIAFGLWCVWLATSSVWAPASADVGGSVLEVGYLLTFGILSFLVLSRLQARDFGILWAVAVTIGLIYLAGAIAAGPGTQGRYSAFGGGPNVFVRVLGMGALGAFALFLQRGRLIALSPLPFFVIGFVLSGSRGGMLAGAVLTVIGVVPACRRIGRRTTVRALALLAVVLVPVVGLFHESLTDLISDRLVEQTFADGNDSGRDELYAGALSLFERNPLLGAGLGSFFSEVGSAVGIDYAHNLVLSTLAESGLIGAVLLAVPIVAQWRRVRRFRPLTPSALIAAGAALFIFVCAMFSGDYYDSRFFWFFLFLSGAAASPAASPSPRVARLSVVAVPGPAART